MEALRALIRCRGVLSLWLLRGTTGRVIPPVALSGFPQDPPDRDSFVGKGAVNRRKANEQKTLCCR